MAVRYHQENIRALLAEYFTDEALRCLCYDTPVFRAIYNQLGPQTGRAQVLRLFIGQLIRRAQLEPLLAWLEKQDADLYKKHQPYLAKIRLFISYKRDVEPDQGVAQQVFQALQPEYDIFIDQMMPIGIPWVERIKSELRQSDFLLVFLSAQSVQSEMVLAEISMAHDLARSPAGRPAILPVRLAYREPFQYPLNRYLDHINWAFWRGHHDTARIIDELKAAISGLKSLPVHERWKPHVLQAGPQATLLEPPPVAQPISAAELEEPEGTITPDSEFYIVRPEDDIALTTIARQGVTITIKAPRQMGKSSLLMRVNKAAAKMGKRVIFLDFQLFDQAILRDSEAFFRQLCDWVTVELDLPNRVADYWGSPLGNTQRCTHYIGRHILRELKTPLVLAMDEVDQIVMADFRSDFFGMLRSWHNMRARDPIWRQLDLVMVTSTEPFQLIENLNQSPFNVGQIVELTDFTLDHVTALNLRHGSPMTQAQVQRLMTLLGRQPFLVRKALYLVASQRLTVEALFEQAATDRGPFGDHLRYHLFRLHGREALVAGLHEVIRDNVCSDREVFYRLQSAGLVRQEGRAILPRCDLYADYFREYL